jgi:UDP-N-acetylglucosamine 2-epimerase
MKINFSSDSGRTPISIVVLLGTRPEAIKMAPLILELKKHSLFNVCVVSTGQHREMMAPILEFFGIEPQIDLRLMKPGQSLIDINLGVTSGLNEAFNGRLPQGIFVQGDTASCTAGAMWGFLNRIPVFHVEAGLRTGDLQSPWPEEFNRRVTANASVLHFAPTELSARNLRVEGFPKDSIHVVGNTVIDALLMVSERLRSDSALNAEMAGLFPFLREDRKLVLATVHRRESFGNGLRQIFRAFRSLAEDPQIQLVLPLHMNPQVRIAADEILRGSRVEIIEPQSYVPFIYLMKRAALVLSDSGGIQEEAPYLNVPVLVLRESTERSEALDSGLVWLVGTGTENILREAKFILNKSSESSSTLFSGKPFGDGDSAEKIVELVNSFFLPAVDRPETKAALALL